MLAKILSIAFFSISITVSAQNTIALPQIINYPRHTYSAGTQNWKIAQDKNGIIYVANDEGLLTFDGQFWKKYTIPSADNIRSLAIGNDGRIYTGALGELGYFEPGKNGILRYTSLSHLIPEAEKDFTDVWDVLPFGNSVFFRSYKRIFELKDNKLTVYKNVSWSFLGVANGRLISKAYGLGLLVYDNGSWRSFLKGDTLPEKAQVISVMPLNKDSALLITKKHGSYILAHNQLVPFKTDGMKLICEKNPYAAVPVTSDLMAIGTSLGGCYIINKGGEIVQRLSKEDGLQMNDVLAVFADREKNLWLGLANGIDFVAFDGPIKHIFADYEEHSAGKSALIFNDYLYICTSNGLYRAPTGGKNEVNFVRSSFEAIPNTKGQAWHLSEINGQLIMGHNDGFFVIKDNVPQPIDASSGFWTFLPLNNIMPSPVILAGTYNGINFYNFQNGKFVNPSIHSHFESARYIAIENDIAWAAHPQKGLYKVNLNGGINPSYTPYADKKRILSSKNQNHLFKVKNRIVLTNEKGFFEYNARIDDFEQSAFFQNIFGNLSVEYLKESSDGNIWFIENKHVGVVDFSGKKPAIVYIPELNSRAVGNGLEFIYPYNNRNILIAGEEGFFNVDYEKYRQSKNITPILISSVRISNKTDSTIFGGYMAGNAQIAEKNTEQQQIDYSWNSIHFEYSSQLYGKQSSIEYSYILEGFDNAWSPWIKRTGKEYTNLSPGSYTFKVKARTYSGNESVAATYHFTILPPWYRTWWAYLLYALMASALIYGANKRQKRKFLQQKRKHEEERKNLEYVNSLQKEKYEEEQKQLLYLHQLEIERNEKEIIRLQNEKLETEIQLKNTELASTSLNLIQQGEMLVKVKEEFIRMKKVKDVDMDSDEYKKIIKMLGENKMKKNWEQFAVHFDKVHSDYLVSLKEHFPNLTPSELKLCAYLRLNLSSKEIAQIMNITIKSVELGRHRLRKKLGIEPHVNLFNYLLNYHSEIK